MRSLYFILVVVGWGFFGVRFFWLSMVRRGILLWILVFNIVRSWGLVFRF